jgi:hypothetical protein
MLVLEDSGGEPLAGLLGAPMAPMEVSGFLLRLAIGIAGVRLTGFGIASRLPPASSRTADARAARNHRRHAGLSFADGNAIPFYRIDKSMKRQLRHLIADPAGKRSIGTSLRRNRWEVFHRRFPDIEKMRVLDLVVLSYTGRPVRPQSVVVVNLLPESSETDWITAVQGDACDPPALVRDAEFDLV